MYSTEHVDANQLNLIFCATCRTCPTSGPLCCHGEMYTHSTGIVGYIFMYLYNI